MNASRTTPALIALVIAAIGGRSVAQDPAIALEPPGVGSFVIDHGALLDDEQRGELQALGRALLDDHATPLIVVTIESMADHWSYGDIRIETFAHLLFDQWAIGSAERDGAPWNRGILLLVSKGDRRARIQLGAGWGREKDAACTRIMDRTIIPQFKRGRFGDGIVRGALALDAMARGRGGSVAGAPSPIQPAVGTAPSRTRSGGGASPRRHGGGVGIPPTVFMVGAGLMFLVVAVFAFVAVRARAASSASLIRRDDEGDDDDDRRGGGSGRRDGFWAGFLAGQWLSSSGGSRGSSSDLSGGGFGGGSFGGGGGGGGFSGGGSSSGGGYSGGGGASGGW